MMLKKRSLRAVLCCLLAITMLIPTTIALADDAHVGQSGTNYNEKAPGNSGGTGNNTGTAKGATLDFSGGVKVSFLLTSADGNSYYKPVIQGDEPLLRRKTPTGLLASSKIPKGYTDGVNLGYYGIGSIYIANEESKYKEANTGEAGIYTDGKGKYEFKWDSKAVVNKIASKSDFEKAYNETIKPKYQFQLTQGNVTNGGKLYEAFVPNKEFKILGNFEKTFLNFEMKEYTTNEEFINHPTEVSHNKAVLATLLQVMINKYGKNSVSDFTHTQFIIIPVNFISIKGKGCKKEIYSCNIL